MTNPTTPTNAESIVETAARIKALAEKAAAHDIAGYAASTTPASPAALPVSGSRQTTHWDDCWRDRGHHTCAVARIERMSAALPVEAQPVAWIRTKDDEPDWGEDCLYAREDEMDVGQYTETEGYGLMPLYTHPAPASPARGDGADRSAASTAGTDAADMIVELRTKLQNLIAELPDTRRLLIARIDAEATLKISKSDTQKDADVEDRRGHLGEEA